MTCKTLALASLALLLTTSAAVADVIVLTDGTRIQGAKITEESIAEVKYTTSSGEAASVTPGSKVRVILRDDLPESYENGQRYLRSGDYRSAVSEFQAVASSSGGSGWLAEYSYFDMGEAYRLQGIQRQDKSALSEATSAYDKVLAANANSRFLFAVHMNKGLCYRLLKDYGQAAAAYEAAASAVTGNSLGDAFGKEAALGKAWTQLESGQADAAKSAFESIAGGGADSALARRAWAGWCEAALASGAAAAVKSKMEGFKGSAKGGAQLAMAHNGLGVALFGEKKYADARLHFVQVVAVYFVDPDEHARALYYAGRCFAALKEEGNYQSVYWKELKARYPSSTWAIRAR